MAITYSAPTITMDNVTGQTWADIYAADVAGSWGVVTEPVASRMYTCAANLQIGSGTNTTSMVSKNEMIYFADDFWVDIGVNATLDIGEKSGDWGINGSFWSIHHSTDNSFWFLNGGTLGIYASRLHNRGIKVVYFGYDSGTSGTIEILNSQLSGEYDVVANAANRFQFHVSLASVTLNNVYCNNCFAFFLSVAPDTMSDVHSHACDYGIYFSQPGAKGTRCRITSATTADVKGLKASAADMILVDPWETIGTVEIGGTGHASIYIYEKYRVNVHVTDHFGANLAGATVAMLDKNAAAAMTAQSTAADGTITEQEVTSRHWVTNVETLTEFFPFIITVTCPGYEMLKLENITETILRGGGEGLDLHLELQPLRSRAYGRGHRMQVAQYV